ncbi:MAG: amino acid ABC transporter permease [Janthinobacterium lividum]
MNFDVGYFLHLLFHPPTALLRGLLLTTGSAIASMILGMMLGTLLALGGLSKSILLRAVNQIYIGFFRGTPILVQLMLVYFGLPYLMGGIDLFPQEIAFGFLNVSGALLAGVIVFGLHEAAFMSEITRSGIEAVDVGQTEAAKSLGMTPWLTFSRIVFPQAFRTILPPLGNGFNAMFKTTSLLSTIAVPELFHVADAIQAASYRTFEVYLAVSVYYLVLTGVWTIVQKLIERRTNRSIRSTSTRVALSRSARGSAEVNA